MNLPEAIEFQTPSALEKWLKKHHATETELWVRIFKKNSGVASVDWNDCVLAALAWGWIDGQKRSLDTESFLQRLTPRRAKSSWSKRNCAHVERLIAEGRMRPSGMAQVEAARKDGRFDNAYAGSRDMVMLPEFLAELSLHPRAKAAFEALNRAAVFKIYYRLQSAKTPGTVQKRIAAVIGQLDGFAGDPGRTSQSRA